MAILFSAATTKTAKVATRQRNRRSLPVPLFFVSFGSFLFCRGVKGKYDFRCLFCVSKTATSSTKWVRRPQHDAPSGSWAFGIEDLTVHDSIERHTAVFCFIFPSFFYLVEARFPGHGKWNNSRKIVKMFEAQLAMIFVAFHQANSCFTCFSSFFFWGGGGGRLVGFPWNTINN